MSSFIRLENDRGKYIRTIHDDDESIKQDDQQNAGYHFNLPAPSSVRCFVHFENDWNKYIQTNHLLVTNRKDVPTVA